MLGKKSNAKYFLVIKKVDLKHVLNAGQLKQTTIRPGCFFPICFPPHLEIFFTKLSRDEKTKTQW